MKKIIPLLTLGICTTCACAMDFTKLEQHKVVGTKDGYLSIGSITVAESAAPEPRVYRDLVGHPLIICAEKTVRLLSPDQCTYRELEGYKEHGELPRFFVLSDNNSIILVDKATRTATQFSDALVHAFGFDTPTVLVNSQTPSKSCFTLYSLPDKKRLFRARFNATKQKLTVECNGIKRTSTECADFSCYVGTLKKENENPTTVIYTVVDLPKHLPDIFTRCTHAYDPQTGLRVFEHYEECIR